MQVIYRLKAKDISANFLNSVKSIFADQEIEITVKTVEKMIPELTTAQRAILNLVAENRKCAPVVSKDYDIRALIDQSQCPIWQIENMLEILTKRIRKYWFKTKAEHL